MSTDDVSRRTFMRTAGGATAAAGVAAGATGTVVGQEDENGEEDDENGEEDEENGGGDEVPDWPSGAEGNLGTYEDARGRDEVTVMVGADDDGLAYDPTLLWVDIGTTITWEWTGQGGGHNVETVDGPAALQSETVDEEGFTYTYETSEDDEGITHYHCAPHDGVGMHAGLAVGEDIPTETVDEGGAGAVFVPQGARALGIATFIAMVSTLGLAFLFMKYGGTITQDSN